MARLQGRGNLSGGFHREEADKAMAAMYNDSYESKEFALTNQTNHDVKVSQSMFLDAKVPVAHKMSIRTDAAISIKLNSSDNDAISVAAAESPFFLDFLEITNIFITNTGTANIKVIIA